MKKQEVIIMKEPGRREAVINFDRAGAEEEILGLVIADRPGDYYLKILVNHKVGNTFGRAMIRGVVKNGARVRVEGMIKIDKGANGVDDFLEMRLLLLDDTGQAVAEPKLEIEANEVKASHAATVGRIDEGQLFYLTSRGVSRKEAENLIVGGFLSEVATRIEDPMIVSKLKRKLAG